MILHVSIAHMCRHDVVIVIASDVVVADSKAIYLLSLDTLLWVS